MNPSSVGLALVVIGLLVALVGVLVMTGALSWFGRLPGDIRIESPGGRVRVFIPIVSMLLVSLVLTLLLSLISRLR